MISPIVRGRWVAGDGPHQLLSLGNLVQVIDRKNKGITLTIEQAP